MLSGHPQRRAALAIPAAASAIWHGGQRLLVFLSVGAAAIVVIQLIRLAAEASGMCTGCNVGSDDEMLWAAAVGGGAAAASGNDDLFGEDYLDGLIDKMLGREPPEPSIEGQALPADPAFGEPADVDAIRNSGLYQAVVDDDSSLNELGRAARRLLGSDVREPSPDQPLPDPPAPNPSRHDPSRP
jgi:hypothetical protein